MLIQKAKDGLTAVRQSVACPSSDVCGSGWSDQKNVWRRAQQAQQGAVTPGLVRGERVLVVTRLNMKQEGRRGEGTRGPWLETCVVGISLFVTLPANDETNGHHKAAGPLTLCLLGGWGEGRGPGTWLRGGRATGFLRQPTATLFIVFWNSRARWMVKKSNQPKWYVIVKYGCQCEQSVEVDVLWKKMCAWGRFCHALSACLLLESAVVPCASRLRLPAMILNFFWLVRGGMWALEEREEEDRCANSVHARDHGKPLKADCGANGKERDGGKASPTAGQWAGKTGGGAPSSPAWSLLGHFDLLSRWKWSPRGQPGVPSVWAWNGTTNGSFRRCTLPSRASLAGCWKKETAALNALKSTSNLDVTAKKAANSLLPALSATLQDCRCLRQGAGAQR